ncbi:MAG TPA: FmdB family zinc ribbon protein [Methylomirabilota bacterium]|nr:FmdB family zinc ribbon protein [Methylomirabilota bacterium]
MPTYDYQCRSCGVTVEVIHSMLADGPTSCERCGGDLRRVLHAAGIIFKGSGFYRTDSRTTSGGETPAKPSTPSSSSAPESAPPSPSESKTGAHSSESTPQGPKDTSA